MASLHLSLAALALLTVPVVVYLLSIPLGFQAVVDLGAMAWILARTILIPISLGMVVRAFFPKFSDRVSIVLAKAGTVGLAVVVLFALAAFYPSLLNMDAWSYLVIASVSAVALPRVTYSVRTTRARRPHSRWNAGCAIPCWPSPSQPRTSLLKKRFRCWFHVCSYSSSSR